MNSLPEWFPRFDADGRLRPESLRALNPSQIEEWILVILREEDPSITASWDASIPSILGEAYRSLDPQTRDCFQDSILRLMGGMLGPSPSLLGRAAEDLLMLAANIFRGSFRSAEPVRFLRQFAELAGDENPDLDRIAWRSVQTLVEIGHRAEPRFWRRAHGQGGDTYLGVVFGGFCLFSPREAFEWVAEHINRVGATEALIGHLPLLVEEYGAETIEPLLNELSPQLSRDARALVRSFSRQLGLQVTPDARESPLREWSLEDLKILARRLGVQVEVGVRERLVDQLEIWLERESLAIESMEAAPFPVRIMYAALARLPQPLLLPEHIAHNLEQSASAVYGSFSDPTDEVFSLFEETMIFRDRLFKEYGTPRELPVPTT